MRLLLIHGDDRAQQAIPKTGTRKPSTNLCDAPGRKRRPALSSLVWMLSMLWQGKERGQLAGSHGSTVVCQPHCPARCSPHLTQRLYLLLPPPLPPPSLPPTVPHFHSKLDQKCQEDTESPCCQKRRFHIIQMCLCVMLDVASVRKSCSLRSYSQDSCLWFSLSQLFTTQTPVLPATLHA